MTWSSERQLVGMRKPVRPGAARVRIEHHVAGGGERLESGVPLRAVVAVWAAMDPEDRRITMPQLVMGGVIMKPGTSSPS